MKKYEQIEGTNKHLKIEVYYNKGGINYFTYKTDPRGYWLSMTVVERDTRESGVVIESFSLFGSGFRHFLLEVKKQGAKSYDKAVALANDMMDEMRGQVINKLIKNGEERIQAEAQSL